MSKNFSKEELEHDPLLDQYVRAVSFYDQHKSTMIGGFVAIIVLVAALVGYNYYSESQELKASTLLSMAEQKFLEDDFDAALKGDDADFTIGFEQIANAFSRTKAGNLAHYYAAVSEFKLGNTEVAYSYIKNFSIPKGIMGLNALVLKSSLEEDLELFAEAAKTHQQAANWDKNETTTPYHLYKAAWNYSKAGNNVQAKALLSTIEQEYPTATEFSEAMKLAATVE